MLFIGGLLKELLSFTQMGPLTYFIIGVGSILITWRMNLKLRAIIWTLKKLKEC